MRAEQAWAKGNTREAGDLFADAAAFSLALVAESGPDALHAELKDEQYARAFIQGFEEIAPDGKVARFSPSWKMTGAPRPVFQPGHRMKLRAGAPSATTREARPGERTVEGTLESVWLSSSEKWIKVTVPGKKEPEVVIVNDKRLQGKVAQLVEEEVRVFGTWSEKARRVIMTEVITLARTRTP